MTHFAIASPSSAYQTEWTIPSPEGDNTPGDPALTAHDARNALSERKAMTTS
jgi:hypothetical protein